MKNSKILPLQVHEYANIHAYIDSRQYVLHNRWVKWLTPRLVHLNNFCYTCEVYYPFAVQVY